MGLTVMPPPRLQVRCPEMASEVLCEHPSSGRFRQAEEPFRFFRGAVMNCGEHQVRWGKLRRLLAIYLSVSLKARIGVVVQEFERAC